MSLSSASDALAGSRTGLGVSGSRCPTAKHAGHGAPQRWEVAECEPRDLQRGPGPAGQRLGEHAVLDRDLERLDLADRRLAERLDPADRRLAERLDVADRRSRRA
jgi:hypothetical protein